MGKLIARGRGADDVYTGCGDTVKTEGANSKKVYVVGELAHIEGDKNTAHQIDGKDPCSGAHPGTPVAPTTTSVYVAGKPVARLKDPYTDTALHNKDPNVYISKVNQTSVFAG